MTITNDPINRQLFSNFVTAMEKSRQNGENLPASKPEDFPDKFSNTKKIVEKHQKKEKNGFNPLILLGSLAGTLASVMYIRRSQKIKPTEGSIVKKALEFFNYETHLKEMLIIGTGSILGGLTAGFAVDKKESRKEKIKEGIYQFNNIVIPACFVSGLQAFALTKSSLTTLDKNNKSLNWKGKAGSVILAVGGGIPIAAAVSNAINNNIVDKDNPNKRKIKFRDCLVHIDDIIGAIVQSSPEGLTKQVLATALTFIYTYCGYEAGNKK